MTDVFKMEGLYVNGAREAKRRHSFMRLLKQSKLMSFSYQRPIGLVVLKTREREWEAEVVLSHNTNLSGGVGFPPLGVSLLSMEVEHVIMGRLLLIKKLV